jgi:PPOX class probable F420-dependent enzyme
MTAPTSRFDARFSDPRGEPTPWDAVEAVLRDAELYWLTTVRSDGRPHVTPLIGLWDDESFVFCTGDDEQKRRNITANPSVAVTTGGNTWAEGTDVVVEGATERVTDTASLQRLADAYLAKYGEDWRFETRNEGFASGESWAVVFRVRPSKVIAFAKHPHAQTTYRPG